MINFNLKNILFFLYFHEHKNIKLNNFIYISKGVNFRVLHSYSMYLQSSSMAMHKAEVYYDVGAYPRTEATWQ